MNDMCTLEEFLSFLKVSCGFTFDTERHCFGDRIKLQKYVFMAIRMGLAPREQLDYSMYIRGPYSSDLADIYFHEGSWNRPIFDRKKFDVAGFVSVVGYRDTRWLEIACSIVYICQNSIVQFSDEMNLDTIYERLSLLKDFSRKEVADVYQELCERGIFDLIES
ncbi:MAG TPA: hypothetical protein PK718_01925 [Candidatus Methanofastidiosa archaeon]|nr:hypothetical protein [Candidatus Methanofastidiosa archaeon]HPR41289.1 hypothetical protein [Candidatus Methanofastidiosa archaeon]